MLGSDNGAEGETRTLTPKGRGILNPLRLPIPLKQLIISCMPTLLIGFIFIDLIDSHLRTSFIIAITTILFGLVLYLSTFTKPKKMLVRKEP